MKVLLTGAAGFIGSHVAKILLRDGTDIVAVDNINDYYDIRLKHHRLKELESLSKESTSLFEFHHADIENIDFLEDIFSKHTFEVVINLAARAGVRYSIENPYVYLTTNTNATLNLLEKMRKYHTPKLVLASSSSVYAGNPMPFVESLPVNEPISPYATSKKAAELMAYTYYNLFKIDVTVLRYFTVFGPSGRPDMSYFRFIKWIDEGQPIELFGDGTQGRDFTFVEDIARGTLAAIKPLGYEIINLGGGHNPIEINYMIAKISEYLGKEAKIKYLPFHNADMKFTWADIKKANELLDWKPTVNLDDGLLKAVEWYQENRDLVSKIQL